ncbi:MAG: hypothetical protein LBC29_02035, partial [Propionibacteriaceae bacterium]|nr:hypothetical protein [Propionibacteriaceae bacterium]
IKFSTLFGLLAVELGVAFAAEGNARLTYIGAGVFFLIACVFVWRSFYGMRIGLDLPDVKRELDAAKAASGLTEEPWER